MNKNIWNHAFQTHAFNQSKLDLPVFRFSESDTIMSTITEKHPATIKTLSMKSYKASHSLEKNPYATGFFASLVPKY